MPTEKEINNILFDQLSIVERIEEATKTGNIEEVKKIIENEKRQINRKLYQNPPLVEN